MRRFACTVLFTCGLFICLAAQAHAYYQDKTKDSSQTTAGEDAAKSKSQTPPAAAKGAVQTPPRQTPAPKIDVKAPQIGVKAGQIGVTSPQIRGTAPQIGVTSPQIRGTAPHIDGNAAPLPGGMRGTGHDPYDGVPRGAGMGVYVPMQVPPRETEEAPPAYGNVPAPAPPAGASVAIPAYDAGDAKPKDPAAGEFAMPLPAANDDARAPRTPPPAPAAGAAPPPAPLVPQLSGRFVGMQGRTMHTWEFRPDGTFEHAWSSSGGNAVVEAGTYSVMGPYLTLAVWGRAASGSALPARGTQQMRRHRLGMPGPGAANAIMLDGLMLKPQNE